MIEHEFCMAADILKILAGGRGVQLGWGGARARANRPLFQPSAAEPRLTRWGFQRGGGPDRRITFHQNRMLHLPEILNFYSARDSCSKGGLCVCVCGEFITLCLAPPEVSSRDHLQRVAMHVNSCHSGALLTRVRGVCSCVEQTKSSGSLLTVQVVMATDGN